MAAEELLLITREDLQKLLDKLPGEHRLDVDLLLELRRVRLLERAPRAGGEHPEDGDPFIDPPVLRFTFSDGVLRCREGTCTKRILKVKQRPHPLGGDEVHQVLDLSSPVYQVVRREDGSLECIPTEDCFISHFSTCTRPDRFSGSTPDPQRSRSESPPDPQRSLL